MMSTAIAQHTWKSAEEKALGMTRTTQPSQAGRWLLVAEALRARNLIRVGWLLCTIEGVEAREFYVELWRAPKE